MTLSTRWHRHCQEYRNDSLYEKIDGGWGWIIVAASFISLVCHSFHLHSFGLMFDDKLSSMGYETTGSSLIYGSSVFFYNGLGPLYGYIVRITTYKFSLFLSGFLLTLGTFGTAFTSQFWHLFLSYSVITGLGMGLESTASMTAISNFFDKWKSTAMGFNYGGYSVAMFLFPPLIAFLHKTYGFWGTQLLLAAITLHVAVASLLFNPLSRYSKKKQEFISSLERQPLHGTKNNEEVNAAESQFKTDNKPLLKMWLSMFDGELLRNPAMIVAFIVCTATVVTDSFFNMYLSVFLYGKLKLSQDEIAKCFVVRGCVDFVARFIVPFISDKLRISPKYVLAVCDVGVALTRIGLTFTCNLTSIYVLVGFEGFFRGQSYVFHVITIADVSPQNKITAAFGLNLFFQGIGSLICSPALGYIRDSTQNYDIVLYITSTVLLFAISPWLKDIIVYSIRKCKYEAAKDTVSDENI